MRLFRTEEAARKAGFKWTVTHGDRKWREDDDNNPAKILTDRERALLEALETLTSGIADKLTGVPETVDGYSEACDLINSMNVE